MGTKTGVSMKSFQKYYKRVLSTASLSIAIAFSANMANAASLSVFSDRTSFNAVSGPTVTEDFTYTHHIGLKSDVLNQYTNENGVTPGDIEAGVTFSRVTPRTSEGYSLIINAGGGFNLGGWLHSYRSTGTSALNIAFDNPVYAFGFDTKAPYMGTGFDMTVNFGSEPSVSFNTSLGSGTALQFFGYVSGLSAITSVTILATGDDRNNFALDDFSFSTVSVVPLPAALPLYSAGLAVMGIVGWRRNRKVSA